ncbi:MAG: hypothetical protein AAGH15_10575 [Myxococcota bacterium]
MRNWTWCAWACLGALALGCGDDDAAPSDGGAVDMAEADEGAAGTTATFMVRVESATDESPLAGVNVAFEPAGGERVEGMTDAAGMLALELTYTEERFSGVAAI